MRKLFISILAILAPLLSNAAISMKVLEDYQKQCDSGNFKKCITVGNLMNKPVKGEDIYDFDKAMSNYVKEKEFMSMTLKFFRVSFFSRKDFLRG